MGKKQFGLLLLSLCLILTGCIKIEAKRIDSWDMFTKITGNFYYLPEDYASEMNPKDYGFKQSMDKTIQKNLKQLDDLEKDLQQAKDRGTTKNKDLRALLVATRAALLAFNDYVDDGDQHFLKKELPELQKQASNISQKYFSGNNTESMKSFAQFVTSNGMYQKALLR